LDHFDRLLVFANNGKFYVLKDGLWQAPKSTSATFPYLPATTVRAGIHVSVGWDVPSPPLPLTESLTLVDNPTWWGYNYTINDQVTYQETGTLEDTPNGPYRATSKGKWAFIVWNKTLVGDPMDGAKAYTGYEAYDTSVYYYDLNFVFKQYAWSDVPYWKGTVNQPPWATLDAAYFKSNPARNGHGMIVFIGP
jgi:hypothetical protein